MEWIESIQVHGTQKSVAVQAVGENMSQKILKVDLRCIVGQAGASQHGGLNGPHSIYILIQQYGILVPTGPCATCKCKAGSITSSYLGKTE